MAAPGLTGPPTKTTGGEAASRAHSGRAPTTSVVLGWLRTTPKAPSVSSCSMMSTTLRSKMPSPSTGVAISSRPLRDVPIISPNHRLPAATVAKQGFELGGAQRPGEVEPLGERAAQQAEGAQLVRRFDAFGDDVDAQALGHGEDAGDDRRVVVVGGQTGDERPIDLEHIDRE